MISGEKITLNHIFYQSGFATLLYTFSGGSTNKDRVLLTDVKAITLYNGQMTTGRRTSPVPQLSCIGGTAGCYGSHQPRTVQCLNRGSDGMDVQWECKATLDDEYQFGRIRVVCEGYDSPEDPYVLKGSCGVSSCCYLGTVHCFSPVSLKSIFLDIL